MQHRKFLFEQSFDAPGEADEGFVPLPGPPPAEIGASAATLAAMRAEGFAEGFEQGLARGHAEAAAALAARSAAALDGIGRRLEALLAGAAEAEAGRARDAARLALSAARRIAPAFVRTAGFDEVEAVVTDCLRHALDEPRLVLSVAETFFDEARQRIEPLARDAGFAGRVVILADARLEFADCRVEWADGGAERDTGRLWREIEQAVSRNLAALRAEPTADAA
ncbi:MAG: flagellar assembly protein FliH [Alphaproteobacteria bacterium]|nr:flagellar assembly protein FliH [Alphaproteobacteria bacterium]